MGMHPLMTWSGRDPARPGESLAELGLSIIRRLSAEGARLPKMALSGPSRALLRRPLLTQSRHRRDSELAAWIIAYER